MVPAVEMGFVVRQASFGTSRHAVWGCKYPQMSPACSFSGKRLHGGWPRSQAQRSAAGLSARPEGSQHSLWPLPVAGTLQGVAGATMVPREMVAKLVNFLRLSWLELHDL